MSAHLPTNRVARHLLFWLAVLLFWGLVPFANPGGHSCNLFVFISDLMGPTLLTFLFHTYIMSYYVLPLLLRQQYGQLLAGTLLLNVTDWFLYDTLYYGYAYIMTHGLNQVVELQPATWLFWSPFPGIAFEGVNVTAGLFAALKLFSHWQQKQVVTRQIEREKLTQELELLKLQLNPAFLFITLDSLQPLIRQQAKQAPEVILKLAHFLRYVLYESQSVVVPVRQEITAIEQFVFLQRIIHPTGLEVSLTVRGNTESPSIAPLSLFPIVENAFNQLPVGQADEPAWVSIDLSISQTHLALKVISGHTINQPDEAGWLVDVQKQLHFYYTEGFDLQVRSDVDTHIISLMLPLSVVPQPDLALTKRLSENGLTTSATRLT
jgi:two-component system, LytTR family, sensor kinase